MIFKAEAEGDSMYVEADTRAEAYKKLNDFVGGIPSYLIKWTDDVELPEGEETIN